ncbi:hypothetical protein WEI85_31960 [Actinomycetes bacterium KLBMP 9797]
MVDPTVELEATKAALQALQPLDKEQAGRALRWLGEVLDVSLQPPVPFVASSVPVTSSAVTSEPPYPPTYGQNPSTAGYGEPPSPEEFLALKRPKSNAEKVACLGFYLSEYRGTTHFRTTDIVSLNTEAAQPRMQNAGRDLDNAERSSGYLAAAGSGKKQISARGKALVRALPNREAVDAALGEHPIRRRRTTAKKAASPKKAGTRSSHASPTTEKDGVTTDKKLEKP